MLRWFELGSIRRYRGQVYEVIDFDDVWSETRERYVDVVIVRSICPDCGDWFHCTVPDRRKFAPNRRCQGCKRPGVAVAT